MKLLLDECVPRRFKFSLSDGDHDCVTVPEAGFASRRNGELLGLAEGNFDVFITLDQGFQTSAKPGRENDRHSRHPYEVESTICSRTHKPAV